MISYKSIALIACYFGKWPPWIYLFFETCKYNPSIDFLFFTDCDIPDTPAGNLKFIPFSLEKFNLLACEKLGFEITITNPYKLCDFKPAFGSLFQDHLSGYDFWGHIDLDLVLGDIREFMTTDLLCQYEILTVRQEYLLGHFTLYRNCEKINHLYKKSKDHEKVFTTANENFCFDECNFQWFELLNGQPLDENSDITSMTHVVKSLAGQNYLKAYFNTHIIEEDKLDKDGNLIDFYEVLEWDQGRLFSVRNRTAYMYFHFHFLKKKETFLVPQWRDIPPRFGISKNGFFEVSQKQVPGRTVGD